MSEGLSKNKISKDSFKWSLDRLCIILQPFVPHISEEIWKGIGNKGLCINESWPREKVKKKTNYKVAVQINGKTKEIIEIDENIQKEDLLKIVKKNNKIIKNILGKKIIREIYIPGKIVNLVIK